MFCICSHFVRLGNHPLNYQKENIIPQRLQFDSDEDEQLAGGNQPPQSICQQPGLDISGGVAGGLSGLQFGLGATLGSPMVGSTSGMGSMMSPGFPAIVADSSSPAGNIISIPPRSYSNLLNFCGRLGSFCGTVSHGGRKSSVANSATRGSRKCGWVDEQH